MRSTISKSGGNASLARAVGKVWRSLNGHESESWTQAGRGFICTRSVGALPCWQIPPLIRGACALCSGCVGSDPRSPWKPGVPPRADKPPTAGTRIVSARIGEPQGGPNVRHRGSSRKKQQVNDAACCSYGGGSIRHYYLVLHTISVADHGKPYPDAITWWRLMLYASLTFREFCGPRFRRLLRASSLFSLVMASLLAQPPQARSEEEIVVLANCNQVDKLEVDHLP
jgi:hypothetical protein